MIENNIYELIGLRIQKKRKDMNLTATSIAHIMGITQQQFNRYERGVSRISIQDLVKLTNIFNVSVSYFLKDDE